MSNPDAEHATRHGGGVYHSTVADFRSRFYERYVSTSAGPVGEHTTDGLQAYWAWSRLKILPLLGDVDMAHPILELGCGAGNFLALLKHEGYARVSGIDISGEMVARAKARGLDVTQGDALELLSTKTERYGAVLAFDLIEHFTKDELLELLPAIRERLLPGGVFVVQTPNGQGLFPRQVIFGDLTHVTVFTPESLEQLLRFSGFEDIDVREAGPAPKSLRGVVRLALWNGIKLGAKAARYVETGKEQAIWTENMLCRSKKPGVLPRPATPHVAPPTEAPSHPRPKTTAKPAVASAASPPRPERASTASEARERVLIIGQALFDMMMDSYQRALSPYYEVKVVDPYSVLADLEKRVFGPHRGAQVNRIAATLSRVALGGEIVLAEPRILRAAEEFAPDLILTDCVDLLRPELVSSLRRACPNAKLIGRFGDAISNFGRGYVFVADYDRVFFKDHYIVDKLRAKLRSTTSFYLPQSCDRHIHRPVEVTDDDRRRYGCDIAVYGNGYLYRAATLMPLLGRDVKVWGGGLPRWAHHPTESLFTGHYVAGDEKARAMLASKIALNPNHYAEIQGTNKRTFELAAIGAFQLTDTPALADVFDPETEVARYDTVDDLLEKLDFYLARPELRASMSERAHRRAHACHTYEHRWVAILETLGMRPPRDFPVQPEDLTLRAT